VIGRIQYILINIKYQLNFDREFSIGDNVRWRQVIGNMAQHGDYIWRVGWCYLSPV